MSRLADCIVAAGPRTGRTVAACVSQAVGGRSRHRRSTAGEAPAATFSKAAFLTTLAALLGLGGCAGRAPITTRTLLAEMTDLRGMTEFPDPAYTCKQFSSYDRKSKSPDEDWFANRDVGQYLREEERDGRKEFVMMDTKGPGAIVRIWSANPQGTLRIYLDGSDTPVIEAPMTDFLGGKFEGLPTPIAGERSRGWNSYFPIPYARHCKVTSDQGGFYYHVNYRTYSRRTRVESFEASDLVMLAPEINTVRGQLSSPRDSDVEPIEWLNAQAQADHLKRMREALGPGTTIQTKPIIPPGKTGLVWECSKLKSGGAIVGLRVKVDAENVEQALRQLLLTIEFDGEETVICPLGDFFGTAPGINPYGSLPVGVTEEGELWSHWVMPFSHSAGLRIRNTGDQPAEVRVGVALDDYEWTSNSMYFHAKWRAEFDVPTRPMVDWNYLQAAGKGVFAGVAFSIANPVRNWWGEGDEKIYVDGEKFPSHFGTGTEDYFGYAWCCPETFTHAYHNQPRCDGPGNYGHTSVNRWHIIDRIPFTKDFRFDMELWHWHKTVKVDMSVVAYWYARPGGSDEFEPIDSADLRVVEISEYKPPRVAGAIEGEEMKVIECTGGTHEKQAWSGLSNELHLWWKHAQPGDKLTLGFEVKEAGRYEVIARFLSANDYGIVQYTINDEKAGDAIELYNARITPTKEIALGEFDLTAGENRLSGEILGANPHAIKSYMVGLDYLRLKRVAARDSDAGP